MTAPFISIQFMHPLYQASSLGIQMNVTNQLQEIWFFLADDRFIAVLKQVAGSPMANIEIDCIAGQQTAHDQAEFRTSGTQKEVSMVVHDRPGQTIHSGFQHQTGEPDQEGLPVYVVQENIPFLDTPDDYVLQHTGHIQSSGPWHSRSI